MDSGSSSASRSASPDEPSGSGTGLGVKVKLSRVSRACMLCRKAKMKCIGGLEPPCNRCRRHGTECNFTESRRGKATKASRLAAQLAAATAQQAGRDLPALALGLELSVPTSAGHGSFNTPSSIPMPTFQPHPLADASPLPTHYFAALDGPSVTGSSASPAYALPLPLPTTSALSFPSILPLNGNGTTSSHSASPPTPLQPSARAPISPPQLRTPSTIHHNLEPAHPLGVLAEASSFVSSADAEKDNVFSALDPAFAKSPDMGIASSDYFSGKGTSPSNSSSPILSILEIEDIEALFAIFLDHIFVHLPIVDRDHCTPLLVLQRSPALFNAICCVSAKYYQAKPHLLQPLRQLAIDELEKFPKEKSLEYVQAQLAYIVWAPVPAASFDADMSWIRMGMIVRMGLDLNMHQTGKVDLGSTPEWRVRSMRRTWLICMMVEKTMAVQMGKPSLLWSHGVAQADLDESPADSLEDVRIYTATEYSQLLERSLDTNQLMRTRTGNDNDLPDVDALFQRELENWRERGEKRERAKDEGIPEVQKAIQRARYHLFFGYAQLILASVGLQHSLDLDSSYAPFALAKYQTAALGMLHAFRDHWAAQGFHKYCTDFTFGNVLYAAVSLLKSVQPQFRHSVLDKIGVGRLVSQIADLLEDAAQTWDHLPFLQAKFVRRVLRARLPEYHEPPRGPLPARLVVPLETIPAPDLAFPTSAVDHSEAADLAADLWMQNDFSDTNFARSELFSWDDFVYT